MQSTTNLKRFLASAVMAAAVANISAQQLAFPGAAGWGRFAKGARASASPTVYHVTNLNDSGTGSLRDAVSKPNRIVVFDVSGVIKISSRIVFSSNLYVAGQTAPGEGVTVYGNGVSFSGASNIICRYLRVRMGHGGDSGKDCAGISNGTNMIFDHCSFSWGLDETFSINPDGKGDLHSITLQNSIFGQGLLTHSAGGLMQADSISLYRNFYCDNSTRNNKVKGINQYANNVVYNWSNGCYIMGGDSQGKSFVNIQSNLFINGPAKGGSAFGGGNSDFNFYGNDNWQDSNMDGKFDPSLMTATGGGNPVDKPYPYPELELYPGNKLLEMNIPTVGASLPYRDQSDYYMVDEVMSYGKSGKLITYETSLPIGAPDTWKWWKGTKPADTDGDGMPDAWEDANGTDKNKADATVKAANGYLNIENYINSITAADRQYFLRAPVTLELSTATTSSITLTWRDYTYEEDGFVVEVEKDGAWGEAGRTAANARAFTITGLAEATQYKIRVRAFGTDNGAEAYSDASEGTFTTRQSEQGILDIDTYQPDVTNSTEVAEGQKLLVTNDGIDVFDYKLTSAISPASTVVTGNGDVKISGEAIQGSGSLNKAGEGTLTITSKNDYKGATVLHGGVLDFNSIANGGTASAIGSSIADAQNWIWDGGTYRYSGASATTNRGARILSPTTLEIVNAATTLTENGGFEGNGSLTLEGKGTLSIADAATFFNYKGETILNGGTLYLSDVEKASKVFAGSSHKVVLGGGTLQFNYKKEDSQTLKFPIETVDGTTSKIIVGSHGTFQSDLRGNGDVEFSIPYLRFQFGTNMPNFTGKLIANGQPMSGASQCLLYHSSQWNAPTVRFELKGKTYMAAWSTNTTNVIGGLSGDAGTFLVGSSKQTKGFTCTWKVGSANSNETFRGIINNLPAGLNSAYSGTVSIVKEGTGEWRLTGANAYSGTTLVSNGTLIVNGKHTGTGAVTVSAGATLKGKGTIPGRVTTANGAIICPGDTLVDGSTLIINGGLTLSGGSTILIPVVKNAEGAFIYNNVQVKGSMTTGTGTIIELDLTRLGAAEQHAFKEGDAITVFKNASGITGSTAKFNILPATPGEGLEWDTTTLLTDGKLKVAAASDPSAIHETEVSGNAGTARVYGINGQRVSGNAKGVVIVNGKKHINK